MRIKNKVIVYIADDADMKDELFNTDEDLAEVIMDGYTKVESGKYSVLASATKTLSLGDITEIRGIFLKADQECVVTINGNDYTMCLPAAGKPAKLYLDIVVTSVTVTSPANVTTTVVYCVWGDEAA
jgi:hypothetical protein